MKHALLVCSLIACGSQSQSPDYYAVGTYLGGGSYLTGPSTCTYDGPASVIELSESKHMGKLVGEGTVSSSCQSGYKQTYLIKRPTAVKIGGETKLAVGADTHYTATLLAGDIALGGTGDARPDWKLGADCATTVAEIPDNSSQDTGGKSDSFHLRATAKGTCTLSVTRMGLSASHAITVQ